MIIQNVTASFPARKISNEEVVDLVGFHSKDFDGDLHKTLRVIKTLLDRSGLITRNWQAEGERPIDHVAYAVRTALQGTDLQPRDIDLFIYVGVGGGFREPANSYMMAKSLGMVRAECFDVLDACMSWTRGVSLVDSLFKTGQYRNAMVVNAEFNMRAATFSLKGHEQLEYVLPTYTIGEAATATLLLPDRPENFRFNFHSKPELADLCTIPMEGFEGFCDLTDNLGKLGVGRFSAMGPALHDNLRPELPQLLAKAGLAVQEADIVLTHSSSSTEWNKVGMENGFAHKIYHTYPYTGNVVSASIPVALAQAEGNGQLKKGQRVMGVVGSAGASLAVFTFDY